MVEKHYPHHYYVVYNKINGGYLKEDTEVVGITCTPWHSDGDRYMSRTLALRRAENNSNLVVFGPYSTKDEGGPDNETPIPDATIGCPNCGWRFKPRDS